MELNDEEIDEVFLHQKLLDIDEANDKYQQLYSEAFGLDLQDEELETLQERLEEFEKSISEVKITIKKLIKISESTSTSSFHSSKWPNTLSGGIQQVTPRPSELQSNILSTPSASAKSLDEISQKMFPQASTHVSGISAREPTVSDQSMAFQESLNVSGISPREPTVNFQPMTSQQSSYVPGISAREPTVNGQSSSYKSHATVFPRNMSHLPAMSTQPIVSNYTPIMTHSQLSSTLPSHSQFMHNQRNVNNLQFNENYQGLQYGHIPSSYTSSNRYPANHTNVNNSQPISNQQPINNSYGMDYQQMRTNLPSFSNQVKIRLPEIPIPYFNGRIEEWNSFKNKFEMLIGNNTTVNDVLRLHYLKAALKGDAATIQSPSDTYESLWNALIKKYELKRIIINEQINNLLNIKSMQRESSADLQTLIENIQKIIRILKNLDLHIDTLSEIMVINIISNKLDSETRKAFESQLSPNA